MNYKKYKDKNKKCCFLEFVHLTNFRCPNMERNRCNESLKFYQCLRLKQLSKSNLKEAIKHFEFMFDSNFKQDILNLKLRGIL